MVVKVLDLFCGGGGSSWGARAAGCGIVAGVDADPIACASYERNFPSAMVPCLRMTKDTRPDDLGQLGPIDLLLASPECTNHTMARGSRPIDTASRETAWFVLNFAADLLPRWIIIENVIQMRRWQGFDHLVRGLEDLAYHVRSFVLDARAFGVPQQRRRLFVVCDRLAVPVKPTSADLRRPRTVADILDPPGTRRSQPLWRKGRAKPTLARAERAISALGEGRDFLIVYYGTDAGGGWQTLERPLRTVTTIDRFGLVTWQDGVAHLRMLQVPELMRAMGFVGPYALDGIGTRRDRIRLLGNGVAPPVMEAIVRSLIAESGMVTAPAAAHEAA